MSLMKCCGFAGCFFNSLKMPTLQNAKKLKSEETKAWKKLCENTRKGKNLEFMLTEIYLCAKKL